MTSVTYRISSNLELQATPATAASSSGSATAPRTRLPTASTPSSPARQMYPSLLSLLCPLGATLEVAIPEPHSGSNPSVYSTLPWFHKAVNTPVSPMRNGAGGDLRLACSEFILYTHFGIETFPNMTPHSLSCLPISQPENLQGTRVP